MKDTQGKTPSEQDKLDHLSRALEQGGFTRTIQSIESGSAHSPAKSSRFLTLRSWIANIGGAKASAKNRDERSHSDSQVSQPPSPRSPGSSI